jgi:GcrA cell cycle regulator
MCRWPIGDPLEDGFTFCGRPAERSYCGQHAQIAYRQGAAKPLDADPEIRRALAN